MRGKMVSKKVEQQGVSKLASAPRKGKRSRRWDRDPDVLMRLESVAQLMLRGAKIWQIAEAMGYSFSTARRDIQRVRKMWATETGHKLGELRDASVAQLREVQLRAWQEYDKAQRKNPSWLRLIRDCELDIVNLQGTKAPEVLDVQSKGEAVKPILCIEVVKDYGRDKRVIPAGPGDGQVVPVPAPRSNEGVGQ